MQEVEITINPDGSMETKTSGFKGDACMKTVKTLLATAGIKGDQTNVLHSAEYYEKPEGGKGLHG